VSFGELIKIGLIGLAISIAITAVFGVVVLWAFY
jgi:hypothetical protein